MDPNRVTLQHIADALGFSRATVSMAMRDSHRISECTRQRVKETAEQLGYRPDPLLSSFSRHRRKGASPGSVIALLGPTQPLEEHLGPVRDVAARLGYRLDYFSWQDQKSERAFFNILQARNVAGLIIMEQRYPVLLDRELWKGMRGIHCGPYAGEGDHASPFPVVRHNPFDAAALAWKKALETGAERIGLFLMPGGEQLNNVDAKTLASYHYHQRYVGRNLPRLRPLILPLGQAAMKGDAARKWMTKERPEVVIAGVRKCYDHLIAMGCRIPKDLGLINLRKNSADQQIAGIVFDRIEIVRTAILHLHLHIQHGEEMSEVHETTVVLNPLWGAGASLTLAAESGDKN